MGSLRGSTGLLLVLAGIPALAQPVGSEFQVNTYTSSDQFTSGGQQVAAGADGNFVVVWTSHSQDGASHGIFAQRYDSEGRARGSEFRVNTVTEGSQRSPDVASDADGNFVVVWEGPDGSGSGILGQRFDSAGGPLGSEFRVNTGTTSNQSAASIASDTEGDFVVVWQSSHTGQYGEIFGQRYDRTGQPLGGEFRVNASTTGSQFTPSVASDADGDFVVAWVSEDYPNGRSAIFGKRYDDDGVPQGDDFLAGANARSRSPSVASAASGNFVVVWNFWGYFTNDEIIGRRFDANGVPQGGVFHVNTDESGYQILPSVSSDAGGSFVVAWYDYKFGEFNLEVFGRRYNSAGVAQGDQFQVNSFTEGSQTLPSVGATAPNKFVVVWASEEQDGDGYGVFGRRFRFSAAVRTESPSSNGR